MAVSDLRAQNERVARGFLDGITAKDEAAIRATLADTAVFVFPRPSLMGQTVQGGDRIAKFLAHLTAQSYPTMSPVYGTVIASEHSAAIEWRLIAKKTDGGDYDQFYAWFFDIAGGKITEIREYIDTVYGHAANGKIGTQVNSIYATAS